MGTTTKTFHVLLADDDHDDRKFFAEALDTLNIPYKLSDFPACDDLLKVIISTKTPDIVFLDLNMPHLSGLKCLQKIRENKEFDDVPVAIYTTSKSKKDIDSCYEGGANLYVVKPYRFEDIVDILKNIFTSDLKQYISTPPKEKFVI